GPWRSRTTAPEAELSEVRCPGGQLTSDKSANRMTPMATRRKVAILGAGMIGEVHRRAAVLAGAEVVGVMASTPERSREVADAWGVAEAYASIDEVAASDVEAVHICTPNASHVPYSSQVMDAGRHELCEQPMGVGVADAREPPAVGG